MQIYLFNLYQGNSFTKESNHFIFEYDQEYIGLLENSTYRLVRKLLCIGDFSLKIAIADLILDVTIGIALTHIYRNSALRKGWNKLKLKRLVPKMQNAFSELNY